MRESSKDTLTVKDIQHILNIGMNSAYALIHSKVFPVRKVGHSYRIPADTFFAWLNRHDDSPPEP